MDDRRTLLALLLEAERVADRPPSVADDESVGSMGSFLVLGTDAVVPRRPNTTAGGARPRRPGTHRHRGRKKRPVTAAAVVRQRTLKKDEALMSSLRARVAAHKKARADKAHRDQQERQRQAQLQREARERADAEHRQAVLEEDRRFQANERPDVFDRLQERPEELARALTEPPPLSPRPRAELFDEFRRRAQGDKTGLFLAALRQRGDLLALGSYSLGDALLLQLCASPLPAHIARADLSDNRLSAAGLRGLQCRMERLVELDLSRNPRAGRVEGARVVGAALARADVPLRALAMAECGVTDMGARALAAGAAASQTLARLQLNHNAIGLSGAQALAGLLRAHAPLRELHVAWNCIFGDGAVALARALQDNTTLRTLDLSWNAIGTDAAAHALADALRRNMALRHLNLSHTQLPAGAVRPLGRALQSNWTLVGLHVDGNPARVDATVRLLPAEPLPLAPAPAERPPMTPGFTVPARDCWVCGRWREVAVELRAAPAAAVDVLLPPALNEGGGRLQVPGKAGLFCFRRVLPPGRVPFAVFVDGEPRVLSDYESSADDGWVGAPGVVNVLTVPPREEDEFAAEHCIPRESSSSSSGAPGGGAPATAEPASPAAPAHDAPDLAGPDADTARAIFEREMEQHLRRQVYTFARSEDAREFLLSVRSTIPASVALFRHYSLEETDRDVGLVVTRDRFLEFAADARLLRPGSQVTLEALNAAFFAVKPEVMSGDEVGLTRGEWLLALGRVAQLRYPGARLGPAFQRLLAKHAPHVYGERGPAAGVSRALVRAAPVAEALRAEQPRLAVLFATFAHAPATRVSAFPALSLPAFLHMLEPVLERGLAADGAALRRAFAASLPWLPDDTAVRARVLVMPQFLHAVGLVAAHAADSGAGPPAVAAKVGEVVRALLTGARV